MRSSSRFLKISKRLFAVLALTFFLSSPVASWACTSLIVGKDASASGYAMFSRTEDSNPNSAKRFFVYPAGYYKKGQTIVDPSYGWTWTWTHDSYRMTATPDMPVNGPNVYDQAGVNEFGFSMSTTNSTTRSTGVRSADPLVPRDLVNYTGGFAESLMNTVILGEVKNSEEALALWGNIVENDGMSEMCFWMMNDTNGDLWITENCGGFRWVAARVPDDSFVVVANDNVIDYVDLSDTKNYRGTADLLTFPENPASKPGKYCSEADKPNLQPFAVYGPDGRLNVAATYGQQNGSGNSYRRWMGYRMFAPSQNIGLKRAYNANPDPDPIAYPTFVKPDRKISALDIMEFQRSRFEDTPYDIGLTPQYFTDAAINPGYGSYVHIFNETERAQLPDNAGAAGATVNARPIGHWTQKETHIYEQIPELPAEIGARWWFQEGLPLHSVNLPFYGNINDTHPAYKKLVSFRGYDPESAYWIFRDLSYLARSNRALYGLPIHEYWHNYEKKLYAEQEAVTKELIERYNNDPADAASWITDYTIATAQAAMNRAGLFRKALMEHIAGRPGELFVVPDDSIAFTSGTFEIHPTGGYAILTGSDIADVANTLGISEWTISAAQLRLPYDVNDPATLQKYTPVLYTTEELSSGHPESLGDATVLPIPGIRVYGNLDVPKINGGGNLVKVRYTAELQDAVYAEFGNSVANVTRAFSLHAMLPGYPDGVELVGPGGLISLADAVKTGKAWVIGDAKRATVMIDFYLYDDAGTPAFGNGAKIVVPDGSTDGILDTGKLWAAIDYRDIGGSSGSSSGCQAFNPGLLFGIMLTLGFCLRRKSK